WRALPADDCRVRTLADQQVLLLEMPRANWIILDSLVQSNWTPGLLGAAQLKWLAKTLDDRAAKPAIVMVHHNPFSAPTWAASEETAAVARIQEAVEPRNLGLLDTQSLLDILLPRKQVKALFYGHIHAWHVDKLQGMHMINLPSTAYVFNPIQPSAWVDARVGERGMSLELRCLNPHHRWHGAKYEL